MSRKNKRRKKGKVGDGTRDRKKRVKRGNRGFYKNHEKKKKEWETRIRTTDIALRVQEETG